MTTEIMRCPNCGKRYAVDKDIYDHCIEIKNMADKDPSIFNMTHPFTCDECGTELEVNYD